MVLNWKQLGLVEYDKRHSIFFAFIQELKIRKQKLIVLRLLPNFEQHFKNKELKAQFFYGLMS